MKHILILLFGLAILSCHSTTEQKSGSKKFFTYDEIHYYFNDYDETQLEELFGNQSRSALDSIKAEVIIGDIPHDITDLSFIEKLEAIGYKRRAIDKSRFAAIDDVFREKTVLESLATSCIYVYRDILIFKKKGKVVGTAKICFDCLANQIQGTTANTENFGQDGDYGKLERILRN